MDSGHEATHQTRSAPAGGIRITIRPLEPSDAAGVAALFHRLSAESRRRRFLTRKDRLTSRELRLLTDVDHVSHEALAAVDARDGSIIGIARYVEYGTRPGIADVAVEVADDLQNRGVATALAERLVARGRANGIVAFEATMLWDNRAARALARRQGFHARASRGAEIELALALFPAAARERRRP